VSGSPDPLASEKRRLREEMATQRSAVPEARAQAAGEAAARLLLAERAVHEAGRVGLYASLPDEIATRPLFDALRSRGVAALFPRCRTDRTLEFARVERWDDLRRGRYGLLEPGEDATVERLESRDALVVPGVAFDARGHRLGRGGGYYDRSFPPGAPAPVLIGLAYELQVVDCVPCNERDRGVEALVTELALRWVAAEPQ